MFVNSLSTTGISTQVWAQAARTLTADPATDAGAATLVWGHSTRNLTGLGSGVASFATAVDATLAASATLDLRPGVAAHRFIDIVVNAGAGNGGNYGLWNGTSQRQIAAIAGSSQFSGLFTSNQTVGFYVNNASANSYTYDYCVSDLKQ